MGTKEQNEQQLMKFAEGRKTNFGKVENRVVPLGRFVKAFLEPVRTGETRDEYDKLDDQTQLRKKAENGWRFRAPTEGDTRNRRSVLPATMMTFDFDHATVEFAESALNGSLLEGVPHLVHTTRRHRPDHPRIRIYIFLDRPLDAETYPAASRIVCQKLLDPQMENVDPVSFRPAQMMFMPTVSKDGVYQHHIDTEGDFLDWQSYLDVFMEEEGDWHDLSLLPTTADEGPLRKTKDKAEDPTTKEGPVGTFCRAFDVEDAISEFLNDTYEEVTEQTGKPRYTYLGGTTRNGAEVQDDGLFLYSHHGSDPCSDMLVNAWDLVRIHKFGQLDEKIDMDTPMGNRPSWKAMVEFALKHERYREQLVSEKYDVEDEIDAEFDALGDEDTTYNAGISEDEMFDIDDLVGLPTGPDLHVAPKYLPGEDGLPILTASSKPIPEKAKKGWLAKECAFNPANGMLENNLPNTRIVLANDARLYGVVQFNEFKHERVMRRDFKSGIDGIGTLYCDNKHDGDPWEDYHDDVIRAMLETPNGDGKKGYGMKVTDRDLKAAVNICAQQWTFHPVRQRLLSFKWDGVSRVEELFIRYLGCEDNSYHRDIARIWMIAAVVRVFEPGHKFDFVPILEGLQGKGKSTFIETLALDWFGTLQANFHDTQKLMEELKNCWIAELPELGNMSRSSVEDVKAFVAGVATTVRMAYARNPTTFKRQQVFMGSTNKSEYLADPTGNRRFWPVYTHVHFIDLNHLRENVEQMWAEAVYLYRCMRRDQPEGTLPLYLTSEESRIEAKARQESRRQQTEADVFAGQIEEYLNSPFRDGDDFDEAPWAFRHKVCGQELWDRALGRSDRFNRGMQLEVSRSMEILGWERSKNPIAAGPGYGKQRCYLRPDDQIATFDEQARSLNSGTDSRHSDDDESLI